jgi:hypothetical protein
MSLMIDSPVHGTTRQRAHSLRPGPARDEPDHPAAAPPWEDEEAWDQDDSPAAWPAATVAEVPAPSPAAPSPAVGPRPSPLPCDGLAVPPTRTVAHFPPIRAGGGRHRLPGAVRRRPGPIAAGLMVAATTLAAGSLRSFAPPAAIQRSADAPAHSDGNS